MADVTRTLEMRITAETGDAKTKIAEAGKALQSIGVNAAAVQPKIAEASKAMASTATAAVSMKSNLLALGITAVSVGGAIAAMNVVVGSLLSRLGRGEEVNDVARAFANLQQSAGRTATEGIGRLREATGGLISDFELMRDSNLANQLGVTPEVFEELAGGAEQLGAAVGMDLVPSLNLLTEGFGRAQDRALKQLGINVDVAAAERTFAASLGISAKQLNEKGKQEAFRAAALVEYRKALAATGPAAVSASDNLTKIAVTLGNVSDRSASAIDKNADLAKAFDDVAIAMGNSFVNSDNFVRGVDVVIGAAGRAISVLAQLASTAMGGTDVQTLQNKAAKLKSDIELFSDGTRPDLVTKYTKEYRDTLAELNRTLIESATQHGHFLDSFGPVEEASTKNSKRLRGNRDDYIDTGEAAEEAAKKAADFAKALDALTLKNTGDDLSAGIERAIDSLNSADFQALKEQFRANVEKGVSEGLDLSNPEAMAQIKKSGEIAANELQAKFDEAAKKNAETTEKEQKEAFQNTVDFYADILTPMFEDTAFNMEDIFNDALKRVAIGFGSQLLAQVSSSVLGLDVSSIGSAQGLGQMIASSIFGGGGGVGGGVSSLLGGAGGIAGGASILGNLGAFGNAAIGGSFGPVASGATYGASLSGASFLSSGGPYALAAVAAYMALDKTGVLEGNFGGTTNKETLARRGIRGNLQQTGLGEDLVFNALRGQTSLKGIGYNTDPNNKIVQSAIPLVNPLAQIFTKGDDKLASDFSGIFANAVGDAKNFNEALINTKSLMAGLGVTSEDAKNQLKDLFLDGKVGIDEFSSGLSNLNIIAQDNLVGKGSVADGLAIIGDESTTNRAKLTALGLTFKEFAELGITSTAGISNYLIDRFGPDAVKVFQDLASAGINSFETVKNSTVDQVSVIFQILSSLPEAFAAASEQAANKVKNDNAEIVKSYKDLKEAVTFAPNPATGGNGSGVDPNSTRSQRAAFNNQRAA